MVKEGKVHEKQFQNAAQLLLCRLITQDSSFRSAPCSRTTDHRAKFGVTWFFKDALNIIHSCCPEVRERALLVSKDVLWVSETYMLTVHRESLPPTVITLRLLQRVV